MFCIGDHVAHPMHGAGVIDSIVEEKFTGNVREYYVFKMPVGGLLLKIPVANSDVIGIRPIVSAEQAEQLMREIPEISIDSNNNWNKRYQENMQRLKSGNLYEVARVIKSLMYRDHSRGLSTGERKMLHNAKQILISEVVLTVNAEYHDIEARLDYAMRQIPETSRVV